MGRGAGGGRTSLAAEHSSLLPPSPLIERGHYHSGGHLQGFTASPLSTRGEMLLEEGREPLMPV